MATLREKLNLVPGARLRVLNPPAGAYERLRAALPDVTIVDADTDATALVFMANTADLRLLDDLLVPPPPVLWIALPRAVDQDATAITRDRLCRALATLGWRPLRQADLSDRWAAVRFEHSA